MRLGEDLFRVARSGFYHLQDICIFWTKHILFIKFAGDEKS